jgi:hypothetical protein
VPSAFSVDLVRRVRLIRTFLQDGKVMPESKPQTR